MKSIADTKFLAQNVLTSLGISFDNTNFHNFISLIKFWHSSSESFGQSQHFRFNTFDSVIFAVDRSTSVVVNESIMSAWLQTQCFRQICDFESSLFSTSFVSNNVEFQSSCRNFLGPICRYPGRVLIFPSINLIRDYWRRENSLPVSKQSLR